MNRRHFLTLLASSMVTLQSRFLWAATSHRQWQEIPLWSGEPPGGGGPGGSMHTSAAGAQRHIAMPMLSVLSPDKPNGHGVLIAGGGGYKQIQTGKESLPAANWLVDRGYTAYVLSYRLPTEGWYDGAMVSLQDAQRALRIVREREKRVSVLGFSAGAHLLGMAVTRPDFHSYPARDKLDLIPASADAAALIYPVITLEAPYTHTSTHRVLVGKNASTAENTAWSVQQYVTPDAPPFFLVQAEDDPVSDPHNSLIMFAACQREHVPVEMYRYPNGGHGFGMGRPGTATIEWPERYAEWLIKHG
ncbi:alpha/beta hydrolase [Citrobacter sp. JGM124]|uniref:alpha/beta hydrolase n=1 Tax=Citrobacter sp. JGM124 TaxID=2799789 RepID=UPI001BAB119A|nr:alpha/beta hydrolase [Citrobacter sp. JGM124]MBS0849421.1 alpha/beta hydrolase [Citrobacter sp. JGM124]